MRTKRIVGQVFVLGWIFIFYIGSMDIVNAKVYKLSGTYTGRNISSNKKTKIKFNGKNKSMKVYIGGKKYVREKLTKIKSNVYYVKGSAVKIKFFCKKIRVYAMDGRDSKIPYGGTFKKVK